MTAPLEPAPTLVVEDIGDELCLYRTDVDEVLVLNSTAADVWRLVDGRACAQEIVEHLATAYGADAGVVAADVERLVDDLRARGFLLPEAVSERTADSRP